MKTKRNKLKNKQERPLVLVFVILASIGKPCKFVKIVTDKYDSLSNNKKVKFENKKCAKSEMCKADLKTNES